MWFWLKQFPVGLKESKWEENNGLGKAPTAKLQQLLQGNGRGSVTEELGSKLNASSNGAWPLLKSHERGGRKPNPTQPSHE